MKNKKGQIWLLPILMILFMLMILFLVFDNHLNQGIRTCEKFESYGFETVIEYDSMSGSYCYIITKDGYKIRSYDVDITAMLEFAR